MALFSFATRQKFPNELRFASRSKLEALMIAAVLTELRTDSYGQIHRRQGIGAGSVGVVPCYTVVSGCDVL